MGLKITVTFEGLDTVIANLGKIGETFEQNIQDTTEKLAVDTQDEWQAVTPKGKTGRLREGDKAKPGSLSFILENPTYYYRFVDEGHNTPRGWRLPGGGYRVAKRRSHVEGKFMTEKAVEYVERVILERLGEALKD